MKALDIDVLLHYHCYPVPHRNSCSKAVVNVTNNLVSEGLLAPCLNEEGMFYTTRLGKSLVEILCATPYQRKNTNRIQSRSKEELKTMIDAICLVKPTSIYQLLFNNAATVNYIEAEFAKITSEAATNGQVL